MATSKTVIEKVAAKADITKKLAKEVIDSMEIVVKEMLTNGEEFKALDLKFSLKDVAEKHMKDLHTKEDILVPARKAVKIGKSVDFKNIGKED